MASKRTVEDEPGVQGGKRVKIGPRIAQKIANEAGNLLECPVCLETMTSPIYQCLNGHAVCNTCVGEQCGECRVDMNFNGAKIRCRPLEKICSSVEVACRNENDGCKVITTVGQLNAHLEVCPYRTFNFCSEVDECRKCNHLVNDVSVLQHMLGQHSTYVLVKDCSCFKLRLESVNPEWTGTYWLTLVTSLDCPVLLKLIYQNDCLTFAYLLLKEATAEECQNYRIKFFLESKYKGAGFEWSGFAQCYRTFKKATARTPNQGSFCLKENFLRSHGFLMDTNEFTSFKVAVYKEGDQTPPAWDSEEFDSD